MPDLKINFFTQIKSLMMDRTTRLDHGVMFRLGFRPEAGIWYYIQDDRFSVRLAQTCFYASFFGFESKVSFSPTVGELEKLYFEKTNKWLSRGLKRASTEN